MIIYEYLRRIKRSLKERQKQKAGEILSPVRRIERVFPPKSGRFVAMTFDDGPTVMKTNPPVGEKGLTEHILDTLEAYGAHGTFDVIGTTEANYPDEKGEDGKFEWSGKKFDHYPDFGMDKNAGAKNQPQLVKRILEGGHQITNHGYAHILFGKKDLIYNNRTYLKDVYEARDDIKMLHELMKNDYSYKVTMARPPHYVDKTADGKSAYDIYRYMNYQYMAASFDGGGWIASGESYERDVEKMLLPLEKALAADENALNGQIIFQKDGCNMSRKTPIASALEKQLELLKKYGYRVISVNELLSLSPVEDVGEDNPIFEKLCSVMKKGYTVVNRNNFVYPERTATVYEFLTMISPPEELIYEYRRIFDGGFKNEAIFEAYKISPESHLAAGISVMAKNGFISADNSEKFTVKTPLTWKIMRKYSHNEKNSDKLPTRADIIEAIYRENL